MATTPQQWELSNVGTDIINRTSNIAQDVQSYRDLINLKPNQHTQALHNDYIHSIGKDMLLIQSPTKNGSTTATTGGAGATGIGAGTATVKKTKKKKLERRNIKINEMDDGGQSIMIDLEWDTSTWGDIELQGGVEALINIFQLRHCPYEKKQQAVRMMTKLLERHEVAVKHLKSNIQPIMNRAISKRLQNGETIAALNLLYVLNCSKQQFHQELSHNNFIGLFFEMMLLECKLAVTLIQHCYRTYRELKMTKHRPMGELAQGWGTQQEIYKARQRSINLRTCDLKRKWKEMHVKMHKGKGSKSEAKSVLYGIRGPIHMDLTYDQLGLEISEYLLSAKARDNACRNREDALLSNSPILLSLFMSATRGSMSYLSLRLLRHISLSPHSLLSYLPCGVINSCLRYLHFHSNPHQKSNSTHVIETLEIITRLAHHAAGVERAVADHSFLVSQGTYCDDTHPLTINYKDLLIEFHGKIPDFRQTLGTREVCQWISQLLLSSTDIAILRAALMAAFVLSCSTCYTNILEILTQSAGLLLAKLIDFFEYSGGGGGGSGGGSGGDGEAECLLGDLSLCLLLQQSTHQSSREGLLSSNIPSLLRFLYNEHLYFHRLSYKRALAVLISLCRIGEGRAYDPMKLLLEIQRQRPKQLIYWTYMEAMKTIKQPPPDTESLSYAMPFSDLILLPSDSAMVREFSDIATRVGVQELCDYFACPIDEKHFSSLSWDMASAGCCILSALVSKPKSAQLVLSCSLVKYLGNCFYFGFTEISNKVLSEKESLIFLSGSYAAVESLAILCQAGSIASSSVSSSVSAGGSGGGLEGGTGKRRQQHHQAQASYPSHGGRERERGGDRERERGQDKAHAVVTGVMESHAAAAANYFLTTFSNSLNAMLPPKVKALQELVALTSMKFLERYTSCLLAIHSAESEELMTSVAHTIGMATCRVLSQLHDAFGRTPKTLRILDDLCQLLARLTEPSAGTSLALRSWNLMESLVVHLPMPLTHVGEVYEEQLVYRNGIQQLPRSLFDLCSSLCKVEQGKALCFSEGFLRRALDKVALTVHHLEGEEELAFRHRNGNGKTWKRAGAGGGGREETESEIDENRLDIASCLRFIALCANFNNPKYGSANEMILHPNYRIVEICARLLNSAVCPRDDSAFLSALKVLRYLARDAKRVFDLYKSYHIISIIAKEIQHVDDTHHRHGGDTSSGGTGGGTSGGTSVEIGTIPLEGIIDIVDFTYHVAMGMKGKHVRKELPKMRDPLTKIARIYFRLGEGVSDVLWAISRNHEGAHVDLVNEGPMQVEEIEEAMKQSIAEDLAEKKISMRPGTYEACGVGTCGSLRFVTGAATATGGGAAAGGGCSCHGELEDGNPESEQRKLELLAKARAEDPHRLELTKERANEKLQREVQRRKMALGLYESSSDDNRGRGGQGGGGGGKSPRLSSSSSTSQLPSLSCALSSTAPVSSSVLPLRRPAYEPLWKTQQRKAAKQHQQASRGAGRGKRGAGTEVISIDLQELPQLVATRPPKPSSKLCLSP